MKRILMQIRRILTKQQQRGILLLMAGGFLLALMDTVTVALMAPFMTLLTNLSGYEESMFGRLMERFFGVTDKEQAILILTIGFIILYIVRGACKIAYNFWQARKVNDYRADLSSRLFTSIMNKPYAYHLQHNSAETQRLVHNDTIRCFVIINNLISSVSCILTALGIIAVLISLNVLLTLILFAVMALFMLWVRKGLKKRISVYSETSHTAATKTFAWVSQSLGGLKNILVKRKQEYYIDRYSELVHKGARCDGDFQGIDLMPKALVDAGCMLLVFGTVLVELLLGQDLNATLPVFAAFAIAAMRMIPLVSNLTTVINNMTFYRPAMEAIYDVVIKGGLDSESNGGQQAEDSGKTGGEPQDTLHESVELSHIAFRYEGAQETLYEDLNLTIPARKSVAFVGTTGSGKTTLADIILGLHRPMSGKVLVDGIDISEQPEWWSRQLGYIPQFVYLCDDTIRANVAFGEDRADINDEWVWKCLERAQLKEFVENLPEGLDTVTGENGVRLSGGQRQRIGIARALYNKPEFLVMDEATSSLDGETEQAIVSAINQLSGDITILIIAHRLSTIENCDIVYRIENGKATLERNSQFTIHNS